jgi:predicted acylesterase/phospholipase RssA
VIQPNVGNIRWDEIGRADELIAAGYEAGLESIPRIRELIAEAMNAQPKWYQLRRRKKILSNRVLSLP